MPDENEFARLIHKMVGAENAGGNVGRETLDAILAPDFLSLTRSNGKEESRADLLDAVGNSTIQTIEREAAGFEAYGSDDLFFVRCVVTVRDLADQQSSPNKFRNTYFFRRDGDSWLCMSWQVTKLA